MKLRPPWDFVGVVLVALGLDLVGRTFDLGGVALDVVGAIVAMPADLVAASVTASISALASIPVLAWALATIATVAAGVLVTQKASREGP